VRPRGKTPGMERDKGEYLDMDEDKRRELDRQAAQYQDDDPALPSMNADPAASDDADRVES
jgi:hypothetical protein